MRALAIIPVALLIFSSAGAVALAGAEGDVTPTKPPVCAWSNHPDVYPFVEIQTVTGRKFGFQNVKESTVQEWDSNRLVVLGGQTRIPYDNIVVIDARCA